MCIPAIGAIIGVVASIGGMMMQQQAMAQQQAAQAQAIAAQNAMNAQWVAEQKKFHQAELNRQNAMRQRAENARQESMQRIEAAPEDVAKEEQRLAEEFGSEAAETEAAPEASAGDKLLSGQKLGGQIIQTDLAGKLSQAAAKSRERSAALATLQAYGGSQFGFNNTMASLFRDAAQDIDLVNNKRRGSLAAYQMEKSISPGQAAPPSPTAGSTLGFVGSGLTSVGSRIAGGSIGSMF